MSIINLGSPIRSERRRSFQPPWYTVFIYECKDCKKETHVRAGSFRGKTAVPGVGGIYCSHCKTEKDC